MGHEHHGPGVALQSLQEHVLGHQIQVIRGLVEKQQVRGGKEKPQEGQAALLPPAQDRDGLVDLVVPEEKRPQEPANRRHQRSGGPALDQLEDASGVLQLFEALGRKIAALDPPSPAKRPLVRLLQAGHDAHQGRFSRPVGPHQGPLLPAGHLEVHVLEGDGIAIAPAQALELETQRGALRRRGKTEVHGRPHRRRLDPLQAIEGPHAALNQSSLRGVVSEAADEALHSPDLLLLPLVGLRDLLELPAPALLVERVGPRLLAQAFLVQLHHGFDGRVQEMTVMGHQQDPRGSVPQKPLEPIPGLQVEKVGRLVEEQQVRPLAQHPRQSHPHPPALGQLADRTIEAVAGKAQTREDPPDRLATPRVAARGQPLLAFLEPLEQALTAAGLLGVPGELAPQGDDLFLQVPPGREGLLDLLDYRGLLVQGQRRALQPRLGQIGDPGAFLDDHLAGVARHLADHDSHQGGFAAAVGPGQGRLAALAQGEADTAEQGPGSEGEADLGEEHRRHQEPPKEK